MPRSVSSQPSWEITVPVSGPRKPSASSTSSHGSSNSLPGRSFITGRPLSVCQSSRTARSARTRPLASARNAFVLIEKSRTTPSSCDDDVRRIIGQLGHASGGRSFGGSGSSSNWWTDRAP